MSEEKQEYYVISPTLRLWKEQVTNIGLEFSGMEGSKSIGFLEVFKTQEDAGVSDEELIPVRIKELQR